MANDTPRPAAGFGEQVRAALAEQGVSVRELARRTHFDHGYISRAVSGKQRPSADLAAAIDTALSAGGALAAAAEATGRPGADETGDMLEFMRRAESSDLGPGVLDVLDGAISELCRDYPTMPGPLLRDRSKTLMGRVLGMLEGRTTVAEHRHLMASAGWLAALLGCVLFDVGERPAAEASRRAVRRFGEQAAHGELIGWSYEMAAWTALSQGRYQAVVTNAEAGRAHAGVSSAGVQLTVQQAKALAKLGSPDAHALLREAEAMLQRLPAPEDAASHFVFDPDKLTSHGATVYTWLGWDDAAGEYAREMAERYTREYRPMRLATARINLGTLAVRRGDLDEAVELGSAALGGERRSGALGAWAAGLLGEMEQRFPGETLVAEYRERVNAEAPGG